MKGAGGGGVSISKIKILVWQLVICYEVDSPDFVLKAVKLSEHRARHAQGQG